MPTTAPTQNFVPIKDVKDNIVILKNGKMCMILLASSINFALKSSDEQKAILQQFQSFLNTLDFSLQIYIQSRRLNIEPYIAQLKLQEDNQPNDLMRVQLREYMDFVRRFTKEVDVMTKNFFVVVTYTPSAINAKKSILSFLGGGGSSASTVDEKGFDENRSQLEQRVNLVEEGLARVGVRTTPLANEELVELFYHIFNPRDVTYDAPKNDPV